MTTEERKQLKEKILEQIEKANQEAIELEDAAKPVAPENSIGRISRMDAINNKSVAEAALRNKRNKISKLNVALAKIDDPKFGNCSACSRPIQTARLMFMPESTLCVRCASR